MDKGVVSNTKLNYFVIFNEIIDIERSVSLPNIEMISSSLLISHNHIQVGGTNYLLLNNG